MFSVLTLTGPRGLGSTTLSRHETFPARQLDHGVSKQRSRPDWVAAQVPKNRGHLTLELGERIGSGRSADVYAVKAVTAILRDDGAPCAESHLGSELCVKVARPNRCRSLAREAWVYEQLAERALQGVITPNCYGFFTTTLAPEQLPFPLWSNEDSGVDARPRDKENDDPTRDDRLCDDVTYDRDECTGPGGRELSPWVDWRPDPDSPCVSVLVMARGGAKYSVNEDEWDQSVRQDVVQILDDLSTGFIIHRDLRPANIVRAAADTRKCDRHDCVHEWNLIDFAWSVVDEPIGHKKKTEDFVRKLQQRNYRSSYFYTARHPRG